MFWKANMCHIIINNHNILDELWSLFSLNSIDTRQPQYIINNVGINGIGKLKSILFTKTHPKFQLDKKKIFETIIDAYSGAEAIAFARLSNEPLLIYF